MRYFFGDTLWPLCHYGYGFTYSPFLQHLLTSCSIYYFSYRLVNLRGKPLKNISLVETHNVVENQPRPRSLQANKTETKRPKGPKENMLDKPAGFDRVFVPRVDGRVGAERVRGKAAQIHGDLLRSVTISEA